MGSVAYKLALVSAGLADITFTLTPKNKRDVVAGAALVKSAGGFVSTLEKTDLTANRRDPLLSGLLASGPFLKDKLLALVEPHIPAEQARKTFSLALALPTAFKNVLRYHELRFAVVRFFLLGAPEGSGSFKRRGRSLTTRIESWI